MTSASGATPVSFSCAETRDRFAAYLEERLVREDRQAVRGHLENCAFCRRDASAQDPAFLFAFMDGAVIRGAGAGAGAGAAEVSPDETARILAAVRTGIELKQAERRLGSPARRAFRISASVAAAAFVAALAGSSGVFRAPKADSAAVPAGPASGSAPGIQRGSASLAPAAVPESAGAVSPFAEARGPVRGQKLPADATIYDWNPGGGQPRVVWIVDRSLDI
ncbi:MAG: zf-HC2 domain-containing protein [Acidobacteriota bacterium]|nr:zf-HC2 domain-containing protein [Acidobacteriota bacterium]